MRIRERIKRLELRTTLGTATDTRQRLKERLAMMEARLVAGGEYQHSETASVAENLVRAHLRGDAQTTAAIWGGILNRLRPDQAS